MLYQAFRALFSIKSTIFVRKKSFLMLLNSLDSHPDISSLKDLWKRLVPLYDEREAIAITEYVLYQKFNLSREDIVLGKLKSLTLKEKEELQRIFSLLEKSVPVQYLTGVAEFSSRRFNVREGVLIPRPETQGLCEIAKTICKEKKNPKILDIGTGSGCIAITLALDIPSSEVHAWDISAEALEIARENDALYGSNVRFSQHDILKVKPTNEMWDIIVSNPPYVMEKEKKTMARNVVDYEPNVALFVPNDDPLKFYKAIASYARETLEPSGQLLLEINPLLADEFLEFMKEFGFLDVEIKEDMYGKKRFACCLFKDHNKTKKTEDSAFLSMSSLCARKEYSSYEIMQKIMKFSLSQDSLERVLQRLIDEGFINEERYCRAFVRDKIRFNKWGRRKIEQALWAKHVNSDISNRVLDEVEDKEYEEILIPLLNSKRKATKAKSDYELNGKLIRFALGRGFDMDIIRKCLDNIDD